MRFLRNTIFVLVLTLLIISIVNAGAFAEPDDIAVKILEDKKITEFNYRETWIERGHIGSLVDNSSDNKIDLSLTPVLGGSSVIVKARLGVEFDWELDGYEWEDIKNLPIEITANYTYKISADWEKDAGSANSGVGLDLPRAYPWYDFIGHVTDESNDRTGSAVDINITTMEKLQKRGNRISILANCQAHSPTGPNQYLSHSSVKITLHSISIKFLNSPPEVDAGGRDHPDIGAGVYYSIVGQDATLTGEASDPDGDDIDGFWEISDIHGDVVKKADNKEGSSEFTTKYTFNERGLYQVKFYAKDRGYSLKSKKSLAYVIVDDISADKNDNEETGTAKARVPIIGNPGENYIGIDPIIKPPVEIPIYYFSKPDLKPVVLQDQIEPDDIKIFNINVLTGALTAFSVYWSDSNLDLYLITPDGTRINADTIDDNVEFKYYSGSTYKSFVVNNPTHGTWQMEVHATDVPENGEDFTVMSFDDVKLIPVMHGMVTDELSGDPLSDISISILDNEGNYVCGTRTNTYGYYEMQVPEGAFYVKAVDEYSRKYITKHYSDGYLLNDAETYTFSPGTYSNIDFSLLKGNTISGHIYSESNNTPIPDVTIDVFDENNNWVANGKSDGSGFYETTALAPGTYYLKTNSDKYFDKYFDDEALLENANPITITSQNKDNINFYLSSPPTADAGGLKDPNSGIGYYQSVKGQSVTLFGEATNPDGDDLKGYWEIHDSNGIVKHEGVKQGSSTFITNYTFDNPGEYQVFFYAIDSHNLKSDLSMAVVTVIDDEGGSGSDGGSGSSSDDGGGSDSSGDNGEEENTSIPTPLIWNEQVIDEDQGTPGLQATIHGIAKPGLTVKIVKEDDIDNPVATTVAGSDSAWQANLNISNHTHNDEYYAIAENSEGEKSSIIADLTRAHVAQLAAAIAGISITDDVSGSSFADVPSDYWAYSEIRAAANAGIVNGYADGTFRPDATTTRSELAKILVRAMNLSVVNSSSPSFPDISSAHWAYKYVETLKAEGLLFGYYDGTFCPNKHVTAGPIKIIQMISGHVTCSENSNPLSGILVTAYPVKENGEHDTSEPTSQSHTSTDGSYSLVGLGSGSYKIGFAMPYNTSGDAVNNIFIPEFFDDKYNWDEADIVSTDNSGHANDIDAGLELIEDYDSSVPTPLIWNERVVDEEQNTPGMQATIHGIAKPGLTVKIVKEDDIDNPIATTIADSNSAWQANISTTHQTSGDAYYAIAENSEGEKSPIVAGLTRAHVAQLAVAVADIPEDLSGYNFPDVPSCHWAYLDIMTAVNAGIFSGYADGTFRPNMLVTRAELAAILVKAKDLSLIDNPTASFSDIDGHWAYKYIETLKAEGLLFGYYDGTFDPSNLVSAGPIKINQLVSGRVTDSENSNPLHGILVTAYPVKASGERDASKPISHSITSTDGSYSLLNLGSGYYKVGFGLPYDTSGDAVFGPPYDTSGDAVIGLPHITTGDAVNSIYIPELYDDKYNWNLADILDINGLGSVQGVDAELEVGGVISGRVTDSDDNPLDNVQVMCIPVDPFGDSDPAGAICWTYTEPDGTYKTFGMLQGEYKLKFIPSAGSDYRPGFYKNGSWNTADTVDVLVGETTEEINYMFFSDDIPPTIDNLTPADGTTINNANPTISATYSDLVSDIDVSSVKVSLDGEDTTSLCTITDSSFTLTPSSDLSTGTHTVSLEVKDSAGNTTTETWSFTIETASPELTTTMSKAYWAPTANYETAYEAWQNGELSVDYSIENTGDGTAYNTEVRNIAATTSSGTITVITPQPISIGQIAPGESKTVTIVFKLPPGTARFNVSFSTTCENAGGAAINS